MNLSCEQDLTLKVRVVAPTYYWPLTSFVGNSSPELVSGFSLQLGGADAFAAPAYRFAVEANSIAVEAGGKITNCFTFPNSYWGAPNWRDDAIASQGIDLRNLAVGFSLRVWARATLAGIDNVWLVYTSSNLDPSNTRWSLNFPAWPDYRPRFNFFDSLGNPTVLQSAASCPVDDEWHRLIVCWDAAAKQMTIKVDDLPASQLVNANGLYTPNGTDFLMLIWLGIESNRHATTCELAFWKEHVLSESEMLADWNGGAGRTWPW